MNRLDREILKAVLIEQKSKYGLEAYLKKNGIKSNYATIWRHIDKLKKDGLLRITKPSRKDGKLDKRKTEKPVLTPKGMATLIIEGNLQKDETRSIMLKFIDKKLSHITDIKFWKIAPIQDVYADAVLKIKPKVNLEYFDEDYFTETLVTELFQSFFTEPMIESIFEYLEKINPEDVMKTLDEINKVAEKAGFPKELLPKQLLKTILNGEKQMKKEQK